MKHFLVSAGLLIMSLSNFSQKGLLVFQTDFGLKDGAVGAMKGVAMQVSTELKIFDLTHDIPAFDIWQAAYRLEQTAAYWPQGTVFVSVVDPGVGSSRKSIVLKTKSGHFFVSPDNGTLTLIAGSLGIEEVRVIDERVNRLPGSEKSYTFHGRDVFAYTGARLAAGKISFQQVGDVLPSSIVLIHYQAPAFENNMLKGTIPVLDIQYGNVWTNIPGEFLQKLHIKFGDSVHVAIFDEQEKKFDAFLPYVKTFSDVPIQHTLAYVNSLMNISFAINLGDLAKAQAIKSGPEWRVEVSR